VSGFREVRFNVDFGAGAREPRIKSYCIRLPIAAARFLCHPDAKGFSPFVEDVEVLRRRELRREQLLRQAEGAGLA